MVRIELDFLQLLYIYDKIATKYDTYGGDVKFGGKNSVQNCVDE